MRKFIVCLLALCVVMTASSAFAANLLKNPGFESDGANWELAAYGGASAVADINTNAAYVHSGTKSLHYLAAASVNRVGFLQRDVSGIGPTESYRLKAWVKVPTASPSTPALFRFRYNPGVPNAAYFIPPVISITSSEWVEVVSPWLKPAAGLGSVAVTGWMLVANEADSAGPIPEYYVDDCQVETGPAYAISGKVVDSITGLGIEGVTVSVSDTSVTPATVVYTAKSDSNGNYTAYVNQPTTPVSYNMTFYHRLYDDPGAMSVSVPLAGGMPDVTMVKFIGTNFVSGKVTNQATGAGIAGVTIGLNQDVAGAGFNAGTITGTTDANGNYNIEVTAGYYYVTARKFGCAFPTAQKEWEAFTIDGNGYTCDVTVNFQMIDEGPLVKVDAANLNPGAVQQWPNSGAMGGYFDAARRDGTGALPAVAVVGGYKAIAFNRSSYYELKTSAGLSQDAPLDMVQKSPAYTVSTWIYRTELASGRDCCYTTFAPFTKGGNFYYGDWQWAADHYQAGWGVPQPGADAWPAMAWHHLVFSCDGANEKFYVDGVLKNTVALADPREFTNAANDYPIRIGAGSMENSVIGDYFKGAIAKLEMYRAPASAEDVAALYAAAPPVAPGVNTISGRVTDGTNPIEGAEVALSTAAGAFAGIITSALTDANGEYSFDVLPGTYYVAARMVRHLPYPSADLTANAASGDVSLADIVLTYQPPSRVVDIDASSFANLGATGTWVNNGTYGGAFVATGTAATNPVVQIVNGYKAVNFPGTAAMLLKDAANANIVAGSTITGACSFTTSTWIYNYDPLPSEESYLCWARRFPSTGQTAQFNYGSSSDFGAVTHIGGPDMGFGDAGAPAPGAWHHIAVSYNGVVEKVFVDGVLAATENKTMSIWAGDPVMLGAAYHSDMLPALQYSGAIASLRVYDSALSDAEIADLKTATTPATVSTYSVSGSVVAGNVPVAGATVVISANPDASNPIATIVADGSGNFSIDGMLAADYYVVARKPLYKMKDGVAKLVKVTNANVTGVKLEIVYREPAKLVDINADSSAVTTGTLGSWPNAGTLGGAFNYTDAARQPVVQVVNGVKAVMFSEDRLRLVDTANAPIYVPAVNTGNAPWTVASWVYQDTVPAWAIYFTWAAHGDGTDRPNRAGASIGWGSEWGGAFYNRGWNDSASVRWTTVPAGGTWHHLVVTYDGSKATAYCDGIDQTNDNGWAKGPIAIPYGQPIQVGARYWEVNGSGSGDYYNGAIARITMYDDAIPADMVTTLYNTTRPAQKYEVIGQVTDANGPVYNAVVRFGGAGGPIKVTGADGKFVFGIPDPGTYDLYVDAPGHTGKFQSLNCTTSGNVYPTVNLAINASEPGVYNANFETGTTAGPDGWEAFVEMGSFWGINDRLTNPWPAPNADMYLAAWGNENVTPAGAHTGSFSFNKAHPRPGVTYPWNNAHTVVGGGTISALTENTLTDASKAWGVDVWKTGETTQWEKSVRVTGTDGKVRIYPIQANTETQLTLVPGATLVTDGLAVGSTYEIVDAVHRWWYPGGLAPVAAKRIAVNPAFAYNFYFKQKIVGSNRGGARGMLTWRDSAGAILRNDNLVVDASTVGSFVQASPMLMVTPPTGAVTVEPRLGVIDNVWTEVEYVSASYYYDDVVVDPVALPLISGKVTLSNGTTPVADATVVLSNATPAVASPTLVIKTNAQGEYSIPVQRNATYYLAAYKSAYEPMPTASVQVNVVATDVTGVNFKLDYVGAKALIDLKAADLAMGTLTAWPNGGSVGGQFNSDQAANPEVQAVSGHKAVVFAGTSRVLSTFTAPFGMTGGNQFTVSSWVLNPAVDAEECIMSWTNMRWDVNALFVTYGTDGDWGAMDFGPVGMGFGTAGAPSANAWHHLATTYDGTTAKVYVDGALANSLAINLNIATGQRVSVGSGYMDLDGSNMGWSAFSGAIGSLQVYNVAQDAAAIQAIYAAGLPPYSETAQPVANITALKGKGVGALVKLTGTATVIYAPKNAAGARSTNFFYIGEVQGLGGLRVVDKVSDSLSVGQSVTGLTGTVKQTAAGEFYLELNADPTGAAGAAIAPLGFNNKSVATDPKAQTNAVRVWGKVQQIGTGYFTISDGYSSVVKVMVNGVALPAGFDDTKTAVVTGVVSKDDSGNPVVLLQAIRAL